MNVDGLFILPENKSSPPDTTSRAMSSDAPSKHPCLCVFAIPELAQLICTLLPKSTNVRLLRTCRLLFYEVRQYVWESTHAFAVVSTIPGGGIVEVGEDLWTTVVMRFPSQLDVSRLSIYEPYIKNLEIPMGRFSIDEYENWDDFLACTRSTPLLPNLEHIRVSMSAIADVPRITNDCANWISAFLSPSLLEFSLVPHDSWDWKFQGVYSIFMDLRLTHEFLDKISQRSPRIESLEIFPAGFEISKCQMRKGYIRYGMKNLDYSSPSSDTCIAISRLQQLRTLSTNPFFLNNDALPVLAQLPLLESLSIHGLRNGQKASMTNIQLPDHSFPSLRHFKIGEVSWETIRNLLHQKSIWRGLRTLQIRGFESHPTWLESEGDPHIWSSIISSCAGYGAPLTSLSLFGASRQIVTPGLVASLKQLPLTTLSLPSLNSDQPNWIQIAHGLPLVENLTIDFSGEWVLPSELCTIFASMPRLSRLSLPTCRDFLSQVQTSMTPPQPYSHANVYFETNFDFAEDPREEAEAVARFFYKLRPGMTYGCGRAAIGKHQGLYADNPMTDVIINETLSKLREGRM